MRGSAPASAPASHAAPTARRVRLQRTDCLLGSVGAAVRAPSPNCFRAPSPLAQVRGWRVRLLVDCRRWQSVSPNHLGREGRMGGRSVRSEEARARRRRHVGGALDWPEPRGADSRKACARDTRSGPPSLVGAWQHNTRSPTLSAKSSASPRMGRAVGLRRRAWLGTRAGDSSERAGAYKGRTRGVSTGGHAHGHLNMMGTCEHCRSEFAYEKATFPFRRARVASAFESRPSLPSSSPEVGPRAASPSSTPA